MAQVDFFRTVRGVEVHVFADEFEGDDETGVPYGPTSVWAEGPDGADFPLTDDEVAELSTAATEIRESRDDAADRAEWTYYDE